MTWWERMNASCICVTEVRILFARFRWHYSLLQCHCSILFQIPGVEHVRTKVHAQGHKDHMVRATVRTITLQAGPECYFFLRSFLLSLEQVYKIEDQPMRRFVLRHAAEWGLKVHSWADVCQIWPAGDFFGVCVAMQITVCGLDFWFAKVLLQPVDIPEHQINGKHIKQDIHVYPWQLD